ncbi:MAG: glucosamine-6-phosphate deaminase [Bacteroidota bacterium]|nr:glucosamine-6-phosphate deaminase [Bacteroidota bacterium]
MKLFVYETYESMSARAAEAVMYVINSKKNAVLCPASGDSPAGLYKKLVAHIKENEIDISGLYFISLDEWLGMNGNDEGSCRYHLNNQLFHPLYVSENNIAFFDGRALDPQMECERIDDAIEAHGGIDMAIVGLGMNGHVGMNEPGTSPHLHSHVAEIDPITQQVGQKYFKEKKEIGGGLTLGIANLMEAKNVILVVSGNKKAGILRKILEEEISEELPASLLRNHPNFSVYLDAEAASLLKK